MKARALMVLGSMSSAGKSLLVTGLCRFYARKGWRVAPFKAQNMSNNAGVCSGGEIGRAQAVQAFAAGVEPTTAMNPILLKPEADSRSQIIVRGQIWQTLSAGDYYSQKERLWQVVTQSLDELRKKSELVIIEGAGSPVELNLMNHDIVNLAIARYAKAPCLLVGDIDRGGIFAQLLGTLLLLDAPDRNLINAFVVNKFRGDPDLFQEGVRILEERSQKKVLGMIPFLKNLNIPEEDAASIADGRPPREEAVDAAIIHFPHISNFDDFDPLRLEKEIHLRFVNTLEQFGSPRVIFLPGTKNTIEDLQWLLDSGMAEQIKKAAGRGVAVIGLCGGFQMLGYRIVNESQVESDVAELPGLGLLPGQTRMGAYKTITRSQAHILADNGFFSAISGSQVNGYEIHLGQSECPSPLLSINRRENQPASVLDGACSGDGRIWGCHFHGLFENDHFRHAWLQSLGVTSTCESFIQARECAYDDLADALERSLDIPFLDRIIAAGG
jgi:adenosylcobyric acid synthase